MPPTRPQSLKEATNHAKRPYSRSTTASTSADATAIVASKKHRRNEMKATEIEVKPLAPTKSPLGENSSNPEVESTKDGGKRRKKKSRETGRLPSSEMDLDTKDVKISSADRDRDGSRMKPLSSLSTTSGNTQQHHNLPYSQPHPNIHANAQPQGHIVAVNPKSIPSSSTTTVARVQKLEAKLEKQRTRLKDEVAKGEERARKDEDRIQALEARIKAHEGSLKAKEEKIDELQLQVAGHTKVHRLPVPGKKDARRVLKLISCRRSVRMLPIGSS